MNKQFEVQETEKYMVFSTQDSRIVVRKTEDGLELREAKVKTGGVEIYYTPNRLYITTPAETYRFKTEGYVYLRWDQVVSMLDDALETFNQIDQIALMSPDERDTIRKKIMDYGYYMDEETEEEVEEEPEEEELAEEEEMEEEE